MINQTQAIINRSVATTMRFRHCRVYTNVYMCCRNSLTILPVPGKRQIILRKPKKRPGGGSKPNRFPLRRQVLKIVYNTLLIYL